MKVTPFSEEIYYPYLLANGNDAVLINYGGAMMTGLSGHIHAERHQGSVCAWYRQETPDRPPDPARCHCRIPDHCGRRGLRSHRF